MRVYVTRRLPSDCLQSLSTVAEIGMWREEAVPVPDAVLREEVHSADGLLLILTDRVDRSLLDAAPHLRAVSTMSVGYDHIDVAACRERGIAVGHTPDVLTETTADLCWALLLGTARRLYQGQRAVVEGTWGSWAPFYLAGQDVHHKTIGIVGLGRIGQAVARRAQGFSMRILYTGPRPRSEAEPLGALYCSLPTLLAESDFVVLLAPLRPETHHLIGSAELAHMRSDAILINAGRGALVDEAALVDALAMERIWGAGLDVYEREPLPPDHPLLRLPRVVALPHLGSATVETRRAMARLAAENLADALTGRPMRHPV